MTNSGLEIPWRHVENGSCSSSLFVVKRSFLTLTSDSTGARTSQTGSSSTKEYSISKNLKLNRLAQKGIEVQYIPLLYTPIYDHVYREVAIYQWIWGYPILGRSWQIHVRNHPWNLKQCTLPRRSCAPWLSTSGFFLKQMSLSNGLYLGFHGQSTGAHCGWIDKWWCPKLAAQWLTSDAEAKAETKLGPSTTPMKTKECQWKGTRIN